MACSVWQKHTWPWQATLLLCYLLFTNQGYPQKHSFECDLDHFKAVESTPSWTWCYSHFWGPRYSSSTLVLQTGIIQPRHRSSTQLQVGKTLWFISRAEEFRVQDAPKSYINKRKTAQNREGSKSLLHILQLPWRHTRTLPVMSTKSGSSNYSAC